jgi:hypothetical protein
VRKLIKRCEVRLFLLSLGTAGYGNDSWAIGHSFADSPLLTPAIYNPQAVPGSKWTSANLSASNIPRMYHSSAVLLPDGVFDLLVPFITTSRHSRICYGLGLES